MLKIDAGWTRLGYALFMLSWCAGEVLHYNKFIKYFFMMFAICTALLLLYLVRPREIDCTLPVQMGLCVAVLAAISAVAMFFNGFHQDMLNDLCKIFFPALFAWLLYSCDPRPNKDFYFDVMLLIQLAVFISKYHTLFTPAHFLSISFAESYSPFESDASTRFTILLVYYYIRKKPLRFALVFLLNYLGFKRINVVFAFALLLLGWAIRKARVSNTLLGLTKAVFVLSPLLLLFFMSPAFVDWFYQIFGMEFNDFTKDRFNQIIYIMDYNGSLLGLGSVLRMLLETRYPIYPMHADLLRLGIETTALGLFVYVNSMFNVLRIRRNIYCYALMLFIFTVNFASTELGDFPSYLMMFLMCQIDFAAQEEAEKNIPRFKRAGVRACAEG